MLDKMPFDPEKMTLIDFKMIKGQVDAPENFDAVNVERYVSDNSFQMGFNLADKLAKTEFNVQIKTISRVGEDEAIGYFHLIFIYRIENLDELALPTKDNKLSIDPGLANALSSVTYSTSRGILLTRLQGTALQKFVLPIINPNKLLSSNK